MSTRKEDLVRFDVLLKPLSGSETPRPGNIELFKPAPEAIEKCLRWFQNNQITVYLTEFGLSGETTRAKFESIFKTKLALDPNAGEGPPFSMSPEPHFPIELAPFIDQITLSATPDFHQ